MIISLVLAYITYYLFEHYEFKIAAIFNVVVQIIRIFVSDELSSLGFGTMILVIILSIGLSVLGTAFNYWIYGKVDSFMGYLLLSWLISLMTAFVFTMIMSSFFLANVATLM